MFRTKVVKEIKKPLGSITFFLITTFMG